MTLIRKTVVILVIVSIILLLSLCQISNLIFMDNYLLLENQYASLKIEQVSGAIDGQLSSLSILCQDWAVWDNSYLFMADHNQEYLDSSLTESICSSLNLYTILLIDNNGEITAGRTYDQNRDVHISHSLSLLQHFDPESTILTATAAGGNIKGLLKLPQGTLLFSAHPILTSDGKGPAAGTLFMGRMLDKSLISKLTATTHIAFSISDYNAYQAGEDISIIKSKHGEDIICEVLDENILACHTLLKDIYYNPAAVLEVDLPRDIYQQAQASFNYFSYAIILVIILITGLIIILFNKLILNRVRLLSSKANEISCHQDLSIRMPVIGQDEVANLTHNINLMLDEIESAHHQLSASQQQYQQLFDSALSANYICTPDGNILLCNPSFLDLLGYRSFEEASLMSAWNLFHSANKNAILKKLQQERKITNSERIIYDNQGRPITILENITGIFNASGELIQIQGYMIDISERKQAEDKVKYLSFHDKLTGLNNRSYFEDRLERLNKVVHLPLSLVVIDVNGLKLINDALGHERGDELLIKVARVIKQSCRKDDITCRWGGDEYMLLFPSTSSAIASVICDRIKAAIEHIEIQGLQVSASFGMMTKDDPDQDIRDILRRAEEKMYRNKLLQHTSNRNAVITSLVRTLLSKSHETEEHTQRLKDMLAKMGKYMQMPESDIDELILLALLHDIGKITVPDSILNKNTQLTESEWEIIKKHSEIGYRIAKSSSEMAPVAEAILYHHECWNGTGYPLGLKGEAIPLHSRMLAIADAYDVMTQGRPYKDKLSIQEAVQELRNCSNLQFDPELVEIFISSQVFAHNEHCSDVIVSDHPA
ncbi:hypothetical protein ASZ90_019390 [hydrocarbon metagenome]|uniref:Uncharacterized protein n=1 Tax=hydrocarbon metagenome TaxID=938273 RepID=A0A0W8E3T5_9ZZZZ